MKKKIFLLFGFIALIVSFAAMTVPVPVSAQASSGANRFINPVVNVGNLPTPTPYGTPDAGNIYKQYQNVIDPGLSGSGSSSGGAGSSGSSAASGGPINPPTITLSTISDIGAVVLLIAQIGGYLLAIAGALSVVFVVIGGIRYITASGNPAQMEGAKKTVVYALVGVVVIVLSYSMITIVIGILTQQPGTGGTGGSSGGGSQTGGSSQQVGF